MRLLVSGGPSVPGRTMTDKRAWMQKHGEPLRRALILEPRGHAGMHGALLTEPGLPEAHAGLLSMHAAGFPLLSLEGVIAATTIALQNKLIQAQSEQLAIDTPAGLLRIRPRFVSAKPGTVDHLEVTNVPCFVFSAGVSIQLGGRTVRVDIAFGGEFYAIADSESVGIPLDMSHAAQIVRAGAEIRLAVDKLTLAGEQRRTAGKSWTGIHGTILTGPPRGAADLRSATVMDGVVLRRSPGGTGTSALLAVLDAMGLVTNDHMFTHEGILGTTLKARIVQRQTSEDIPFIVPVVEGAAFITGRHQWEWDDRDRIENFMI